MPAFRIVYLRPEANTPDTITTAFDTLDQALDAFAARGLGILYIAERRAEPRCLAATVGDAARKGEAKPAPRSSFPLRRFSQRAMA